MHYTTSTKVSGVLLYIHYLNILSLISDIDVGDCRSTRYLADSRAVWLSPLRRGIILVC